MDGIHDGRRYEAGGTVKLEIVLHHRANLREVRVIFENAYENNFAPLIARSRPRPISERALDGSLRSRLHFEIVIPGTVTPGVYELTRISYETAGGQLGHLPESENLAGFMRMTFEVVGEPSDTLSVVDIAFADS
jgi:hypothetical protein